MIYMLCFAVVVIILIFSCVFEYQSAYVRLAVTFYVIILKGVSIALDIVALTVVLAAVKIYKNTA